MAARVLDSARVLD